MSFELGFIKRAMEYGLCYVDAETLYKQAAGIPGTNQSKLEALARGAKGQGSSTNPSISEKVRRDWVSDEPIISLPGAPGYQEPGVLRNLASGAKDVAWNVFAAPPINAVKQMGDTYSSLRNGQWNDAGVSALKALGNTGLTALNFVPGLGLGAGTAAKGLSMTARGLARAVATAKNVNNVRKLDNVARGLGAASEVMGGNVLSGAPRLLRGAVPVSTLATQGLVSHYSSEPEKDPLAKYRAAQPPSQ